MRTWMIEARGSRSQTEIASMAEVSQQMYSAIERGEANPSVPAAKRLSDVLNVHWDKFFSDEADDPSATSGAADVTPADSPL